GPGGGAYNGAVTGLARGGAASAAVLLALAAPAEAFKVTVTPSTLRQGDVAMIVVTGAASAPQMDGSVAGRPLFFFPYADGYAALIGIDLETRPGRLPWRIGFVDGGGAPRHASGHIICKSRHFTVH